MQLCLRPSSSSNKFRDGSVQSTTENFMLSYSLHTALCLMYQLWTAQPKTGRKANCDALHVSMCMSVVFFCFFWNMNCSSYCSWVRALQEAHYSVSIHHDYLTFNNCLFTDQRTESMLGFCGHTQLWQDLFFFYFLCCKWCCIRVQIILGKCEITYVYWAKNTNLYFAHRDQHDIACYATNPPHFLNLHEKQAN